MTTEMDYKKLWEIENRKNKNHTWTPTLWKIQREVNY